jgi:hypothetical protein
MPLCQVEHLCVCECVCVLKFLCTLFVLARACMNTHLHTTGAKACASRQEIDRGSSQRREEGSGGSSQGVRRQGEEPARTDGEEGRRSPRLEAITGREVSHCLGLDLHVLIYWPDCKQVIAFWNGPQRNRHGSVDVRLQSMRMHVCIGTKIPL